MNLKGDFPNYKIWSKAVDDIERITIRNLLALLRASPQFANWSWHNAWGKGKAAEGDPDPAGRQAALPQLSPGGLHEAVEHRVQDPLAQVFADIGFARQHTRNGGGRNACFPRDIFDFCSHARKLPGSLKGLITK